MKTLIVAALVLLFLIAGSYLEGVALIVVRAALVVAAGFTASGSATGQFIADLFDGNPDSTAQRGRDEGPGPTV